MTSNYWLDLFTLETWKEFQDHGSNVAGFREGRWTQVRRMKPGDYLLCYLTGASKWIGLLEVIGDPFQSRKRIWSSQPFSSRVPVRALIILERENGIPVLNMREELELFRDIDNPKHWSGPFRQSARKFSQADGEAVVRALHGADTDTRA